MNLMPGRRVSVIVAGMVRVRTALVTDRKDRFGWCMLRVDGPPGDSLIGVDLRCEDYEPLSYVGSVHSSVVGAA